MSLDGRHFEGARIAGLFFRPAGEAKPFKASPEAGADSTVCHLKHALDHIEDVAITGPMLTNQVCFVRIEHSVENVSGQSDVVDVANGTDKGLRNEADGRDEVGRRGGEFGSLEGWDAAICPEFDEDMQQVWRQKHQFGVFELGGVSGQPGAQAQALFLIKIRRGAFGRGVVGAFHTERIVSFRSKRPEFQDVSVPPTV